MGNSFNAAIYVFYTGLYVLGFYAAVPAEHGSGISKQEQLRRINTEIALGQVEAVVPDQRLMKRQDLPRALDRSQSSAYPPARGQAGGSCSAWGSAYYGATYVVATYSGWDAGSGDNQYIMSPQWTYNMINKGGDNGGWPNDNHQVLKYHGAATWEDFPQGEPNPHTSWSTDPEVWRKALFHRVKSIFVLEDIDTPAGLVQLKTYLNDDLYHVAFSTNSPTSGKHWVFTDILDDPSTDADDALVGQRACYYVLSNRGGTHTMCVVGWNDDLWVDVNQNGNLDEGERGALKIGESHGPDYINTHNGCYWLAYDALYGTSQVQGGPNAERVEAIHHSYGYVAEYRGPYVPKLAAEFTLKTAARDEIQLTFLRTGIQAQAPFSSPEAEWQGWVFGKMEGTGKTGFDGEDYASNPNQAPEGSFVFDVTEIVPSAEHSGSDWRYVIKIEDDTFNRPLTVTSFRLIEPVSGTVLAEAEDVPVVVDNGVEYLWLDLNLQHIVSSISAQKTGPLFGAPGGITPRGVTAFLRQGVFSFTMFDAAGGNRWSHSSYSNSEGLHHISWKQVMGGSFQPRPGPYFVSLEQDGRRIVRRITMH